MNRHLEHYLLLLPLKLDVYNDDLAPSSTPDQRAAAFRLGLMRVEERFLFREHGKRPSEVLADLVVDLEIP